VADEQRHAAPAFFAADGGPVVEVADDFGIGHDPGERLEVI
jgi:hypothetical protein